MNNKYNIGDIVFHNSSEGPQGMVVDWRYYAYTNTYGYLVSWDEKDSNWYIDVELSDHKVFS